MSILGRICRVLGAVLLVLVGLSTPTLAQEDGPLALAMQAVHAENWSEATTHATTAGPLATDIVAWHSLRARQGSFAEYGAFLRDNADWPGLPLLQRRGEARIDAETPAQDVIEYFADAAPQTGNGSYYYARALIEEGQTEAGRNEARRAWKTIAMTTGSRVLFLETFAETLAPHHEARLDMLLWRGRTDEAAAMLPLVSEGWQALARARIALRRDRNGVDALIAAVPAAFRDDPGLAYERFLWRFEKRRHDSAIELMLARSSDAASLGQPARWGGLRRSLTRRLMRGGDVRAAYNLAANHHLSEGRDYADLEWLSGYIALRQLDEPEVALQHFRRFRAAVWTPISLGRAGYWEGRAHEALGDGESARAAYAFGAEYQTSFYGLLAAERAGLPMDAALIGDEEFPAPNGAAFLQSSVMRAALELHSAGELALARRFMLHLGETLTRTELGQMADIALALNDPHIALMIAKGAARQGHVLARAYYPLHPLGDEALPVPPELALSIARRESEFDPGVISPAGARGLMQLMTGTARDVSADLEVEYDRDRLLSDWQYNARLGSAYLSGLIDEFGPSYVLVAAGYNAGPGRPVQWMQRNGDPRRADIDVVDWIEHIPFRETRNYVMRVMESLPVYRARLSGQVAPLTLSEELHRTP